jgi:hypothetical protein
VHDLAAAICFKSVYSICCDVISCSLILFYILHDVPLLLDVDLDIDSQIPTNNFLFLLLFANIYE